MRLSETGEGEGWPTAGPALAGRERDLAQLWPGVRAELCLARDISPGRKTQTTQWFLFTPLITEVPELRVLGRILGRREERREEGGEEGGLTVAGRAV